MRTEEEVNRLVDDMKSRNKGAYLTQGVAFNKECPRQMELLKYALKRSVSFSGLVKELLALSLNGGGRVSNLETLVAPTLTVSHEAPTTRREQVANTVEFPKNYNNSSNDTSQKRLVGNFL